MSTPEERQAKALESIARDISKIPKILETVNNNLVLFVKQLRVAGLLEESHPRNWDKKEGEQCRTTNET